MIKRNTTFILGAGSSMAYGFPSGKTLKALIWKTIGTPVAVGKYRAELPPYFYLAADCSIFCEKSKKEFEEKVDGFRDNLMLSPDETIDYFLEHVSGDEYRKIGRLTIADVLLRREREANLFEEWMRYYVLEKLWQQQEFSADSMIRPEDRHWYQFLFNQMCGECKSIECFPQNKVSIVTFNYDRSFEYFFLRSLMSKFKAEKPKAAEILNQLPIVHVYGQLGELPELIPQNDNIRTKQAVPYDALPSKSKKSPINPSEIIPIEQNDYADRLRIAAHGIQLVWDKQVETENTQKAKSLICSDNNRIVFLGFGYDPINLERIIPSDILKTTTNIFAYGTTFGISQQRSAKMKNMFVREHNNGQVRSLFDDSHGQFKKCTIYDFLFNSTEIFQ